jgi:hypothetical protein
VTQDIDMQDVWIEDVMSAFVLLGADDGHNADPEATHTARIRFRNWLARLSPGGKNFEISADSYDIDWERLTFVGTGLYAQAIVDGKVTRLRNISNIFASALHPFIGARGEHNVIKHLFPDPVAWDRVLVVGPGGQAIPDAVNKFLPGKVMTAASPESVFAAPTTWPSGFTILKGSPYEGLGADVAAIEMAVRRS